MAERRFVRRFLCAVDEAIRTGGLRRASAADDLTAIAGGVEHLAAERDRLRRQNQAAIDALTAGCDDVDCHIGCRVYPWKRCGENALRILTGEVDAPPVERDV